MRQGGCRFNSFEEHFCVRFSNSAHFRRLFLSPASLSLCWPLFFNITIFFLSHAFFFLGSPCSQSCKRFFAAHVNVCTFKCQNQLHASNLLGFANGNQLVWIILLPIIGGKSKKRSIVAILNVVCCWPFRLSWNLKTFFSFGYQFSWFFLLTLFCCLAATFELTCVHARGGQDWIRSVSLSDKSQPFTTEFAV